MKFYNYITEKKAKLTGDQHKDHFLKILNKWDTDLSKMTKAYKSLKVSKLMEFYEKNEYGNYQLKKNFMNHPDMKKFLMMRNAFSIFSNNFETWIYTKILSSRKAKNENYYQTEVRTTA